MFAHAVALLFALNLSHAERVESRGADVIAADADHAPNPGAIRDLTLSLNGTWKFAIGNHTGALPQFDRKIVVPFVPESKASGLNEKDLSADQFESLVEYEKDIVLGEDWHGGLLHFEGIDYAAEIFVNGQLAGTHIGAYAPFAVDISPWLSLGRRVPGGHRHTIRVRVRDSKLNRRQLVGKQERLPNEGVIFYRNMTGIWKDVYLEKIDSAYVQDLWLSGDHHGELRLKADISDPQKRAVKARFLLRFEDSPTPVLTREIAVIDGRVELAQTIADVKPWSTDTPNLYFSELILYDSNHEPVDRVRSYVSFVTFTQKNGYLTENGVPFQVRGHLNQHVYPDTLYTPTRQKIASEIEYFKDAGFNSERYHQTTPPRWALYMYSRHGVRVSLEMPSARDLRDPVERQEAGRQWREINLKLGGPGCIGWRVGPNETWGMLDDPDHLAATTDENIEGYLRQMHQITLDAQLEMAPAQKPSVRVMQPFNDGWQSITAHREQTDPTIDPSSYFIGIHDYKTGDELRQHYGALMAGEPLPRTGQEALLPGFKWNKNIPVMLSEMGGSSYSHRLSPHFFTYHNFLDVEHWGAAMANTIRAAGEIPIFTAGYVLTQSMDAGNDPLESSGGGEQNGLLSATLNEEGAAEPKLPAEYWRAANDQAHASWRQNLCHRLLDRE